MNKILKEKENALVGGKKNLSLLKMQVSPQNVLADSFVKGLGNS